MTATRPPAAEEIPGVTRRHRLSDLYHERTNFRFVAHSRRWAILSGTLLLVSVVALAVRGLNLSIEFEGGTAWVVEMQNDRDASVAEVRELLQPLGFADSKIAVLTGAGGQSVRVQAEVVEDPTRRAQAGLAALAGIDAAGVQFASAEGGGGTFTFTAAEDAEPTEEAVAGVLAEAGLRGPEVAIDGREVTVTVEDLPASPLQQVADALAGYAGVSSASVSVSTVGPTWGETVTRKAAQAMVIFFVLLAIYLSFRFEWKMAAAAILAVLHDIVVTAGLYALFRFEVTPATVTAFLTILGFSLYDTVVVFDKVAENERTLTATGRSTYGEMVNRSLNAVLMRSLSTTLVALLPVLSLLVVGSLIMGATALEEFAIALAAGLFIGSYSSLFVAAPLLAWWKGREPQYRALADRQRRATLAASSAATGVPVVADPHGPRVATVAEGVPGPPAVGRTVRPRPRRQRGRKRR